MTVLDIVLLVGLAAVLVMLWALFQRVQAMTQVQIELREVTTRMQSMEQSQSSVGQNLTSLASELSQARMGLTALQSHSAARMSAEEQISTSVRRLETIIAGTYSKGAAGENIIDVVFSKLPPDWQVRDFRIGNRTVEFALRLPNNRILPIDSKWPATDLIERLAASDDPYERARLKDQIGVTVLAKAKEVQKYLDPSLTVNFGVAAVPDAVYDVCGEIQVACFERNVVLVAYSMFVPYLMLVFQTVLKTSQDIDLEKLDAHLRMAERSVATLQAELEGRFSRAITMLTNSKTEIAAQLSHLSSGLTSVHVHAGLPDEADASAIGAGEESGWLGSQTPDAGAEVLDGDRRTEDAVGSIGRLPGVDSPF